MRERGDNWGQRGLPLTSGETPLKRPPSLGRHAQEQERGARHELDARRPEDLHRLRGRRRDRGLSGRQPAVGEGARDEPVAGGVEPGRPPHPILHPAGRVPHLRPERQQHLQAAALLHGALSGSF